MAIKEDYEKAVETGDYWRFIGMHGGGKFSKKTGERMPVEALNDATFQKHVAIDNAVTNALLMEDYQSLLVFGDGSSDYSNDGIKLNQYIKVHMQNAKEKDEKRIKDTYKLFKENRSKKATAEEWQATRMLLESDAYREKIKSGLPFKIERKKHEAGHSFIYLNDELFVFEEIIGRGGFGKVKKITDCDGNRYAVKVVAFGGHSTTKSHSEITALKKLGMHFGDFEKDYSSPDPFKHGDKKRYFLMPFIVGCPLHEFIEKTVVSDQQKLTIFQNIAYALEALHNKGIIFCDMHSGNIMINPDTLQVTFIDFGLAALLPPGQQQVMNSNFMNLCFREYPPELDSNGGFVSPATDIWLLAQRIFSKIEFYKVDIKPVIQLMKADDPEKRISLKSAAERLRAIADQAFAFIPGKNI